MISFCLKTSRRLIDSVFQQTDEAFKGAEGRPTAQKGGAYAPPKTLNFFLFYNSGVM